MNFFEVVAIIGIAVGTVSAAGRSSFVLSLQDRKRLLRKWRLGYSAAVVGAADHLAAVAALPRAFVLSHVIV